MKKFKFRLQKVMDFREAMESLAKDAYLDARAQRLEAEAVISSIESRRLEMLREPCTTIDAHQAIEGMMVRLDDEVRAQYTVISVLQEEEAQALQHWQNAKKEYEVLVKLHEKAIEEYRKEEGLEEQKELDEWSVTRRAA
ncbi:MAG: flagellar export protein FliJ [Armatimonadetes bacterium 55-13]|nr:flagellar export protein FliJ [Armatimonadota bacterium]OJU65465.1 MAG: flagellar export protein FliJ [Armatimonadetes bacterium 55-13]